MLIIYSSDRAEKLARQYEKMRWFTVQRALVRVPTEFRFYGAIRLDRGPYARVYKKGKLFLVIEHEWINRENVMM